MSPLRTQATRRRLVTIAALAGAAGAALLHLPRGAPRQAAASQRPPASGANGSGYRLTEHIKSYYRSTLV